MSLWKPYVNDSTIEQPLDLSVKRKPTSSATSATPVIVYPQYSSHPVQSYTMQGINHCQSAPSCSSAQLPIVNPPVRIGVLSPPFSLNSENSRNGSNFMANINILENDPGFQAFKRNAIKAMIEKNGGSLLGHNPKMRRAVQRGHNVDDFYRKQREKNNLAAKQSRDKRKLREIDLALKVTYLSNVYAELRASSNLCMNCDFHCEASHAYRCVPRNEQNKNLTKRVLNQRHAGHARDGVIPIRIRSGGGRSSSTSSLRSEN